MLTNLFLYTGIFTGFCASCLFVYVARHTNYTYSWAQVGLIFSSTLSSYCAVQLLPSLKYKSLFTNKDRWIDLHQKFLIPLLIISSILFLFLLKDFDLKTFIFFGLGSLPVLFYNGIFSSKLQLRKIAFLKPFLISFLWTYLSYGLIVIETEKFDLTIFLHVFIYIFSLCLLYDVRDMRLDQKMKLRTFNTYFSERIVKLSSFVLFVFALLLLPKDKIAFMTLTFLHGSLCIAVQDSCPDYYVMFGVDLLIPLLLMNA